MTKRPDAAANMLRERGFSGDLGPAWQLELPDGTTIQVAGVDAHDEPGEPRVNKPAFAHMLRDPMDHATLIKTVQRPTLHAVLKVVDGWIRKAGKTRVLGRPRIMLGRIVKVR